MFQASQLSMRARIIAIAIALTWSGLAVGATPQALPGAAEAWRVVLLNNSDFLIPASAVMDQALRETLVKLAPRQIAFYGETLDLLRFPEATQSELVALLRKKHANHHVDLAMARA